MVFLLRSKNNCPTNKSQNRGRVMVDATEEPAVLDTVQSLINELIQKQSMLLSNVHDDNELLSNCDAISKVHSTMIKTQQYYKKVLCVKKDLMDMHKQSQKLKERALKLSANQQALAQKRKHQMDEQERLEQNLIAKPVKKNVK